MNWYKKAKLIDIDPPNEMVLHCMYCDRWATTEGINVPRETATWKKQTVLNDQERAQVAEAKSKSLNGVGGYSSGMCPVCVEIVKSFTNKGTIPDPNVIRSISLTLP